MEIRQHHHLPPIGGNDVKITFVDCPCDILEKKCIFAF